MTNRGMGILVVCMITLLVLPNTVYYLPYAEDPLITITRKTSHVADFDLAQLQEHSSISVYENNDLAGMGFPGDGSLNNPYIIQNLEITSIGVSIGITNFTAHLLIRNCVLISMSSAERVPIHLSQSGNISIEDCMIRGGRYGIRIRNVSEVDVIGNRIYDATGVDVGGNIFDGFGIYLEDSDQCNITGNTVYANNIGIALESSKNCSITENNLYGNDGPGLDLSGSSVNNTVSENVFGWNSQPLLPLDNALDRGWNNTWSGNSWSDYIPPGPYNVSGTAGSQDLEPSSLEDTNIPLISSPDDIVAGEGSDVHANWTTSDQFPLRYQVLVDGQVRILRTWNQSDISFSISGLSVGTYDVALIITDAAGNEAENSVLVTVLFVVFSDIGTDLVVVASVLSVLAVAFVVYVIKRRQ